MKSVFQLLFSAFLLASCAEKIQDNIEPEKSIEAADSTEVNVDEIEDIILKDSIIDYNIDGWIKIQFKDLTIAFEEIEVDWEGKYSTENDTIYKPKSDTAQIYLYPVETVEELKFKIISSEYNEIEVFEKTVYHVTMNSLRDREVPMSVLSKWKSYESKWNRIEIDQSNPMFNTSQEKENPVINFTNDEFLAAVKEYCGVDWFDEIKTITSVEEMPSDIFLSYHLFKVIVRNSESGKTKEKFIAFYTATSC